MGGVYLCGFGFGPVISKQWTESLHTITKEHHHFNEQCNRNAYTYNIAISPSPNIVSTTS